MPPPGGRVWEGAALAQGHGESGFPHSPTRWEVLGGRGPPRNNVFSSRWGGAGGWGNPVSPAPCPASMGAGAAPARMRAGGPRTQARAYGLPAGGFGRAQPFSPAPARRAWGRAPPPRGCGPEARAPRPVPMACPREGLGGRSPPRNNVFSSGSRWARLAATPQRGHVPGCAAELCLKELLLAYPCKIRYTPPEYSGLT